jgi:histone-lysine N-methyltransferase SETMAR
MQFAGNFQVNWQEGCLLLHHYNARTQTARVAEERIQELQWELPEHLPYSPDLAPSDFHLLGPSENTWRKTF